MINRWRGGCALALLCLLPAAGATAQEPAPAPLILPLEGHVELEPRTLSLHVVLPFESYGEDGLALEAFLERPAADSWEAGFARLMRGLKEEDVAAAGPFISRETSEAAQTFRAERVALWHQAFGGFEEARVLGRSDLGEMQIFYWDAPRGQGRFTRSFMLRRVGAAPEDSGGFTASLTSSNWPLTATIVDSLPLRGDAPERLPAAANLSIPLAFSLGDSRVNLVGEGYAPNFDVFQGQLDSAYPPLRFYAETWRLLPRGDLDGFAQRWTGGSAEKIRGQLSNQPQAFLDIATQPRRVWLVLHARPLYFVFYTAGPNPLSPRAPVRFDTLVEHAEGSFRLTNHFYERDLDQVLKDATAIPLEDFMAKVRPL